MKKLLSLALVFVLLLSFAGCGKEAEAPEETEHIHIWKPATCVAPKTCLSCRATEGEPGTHALDVGTCPKCEKFQNKELVNTLQKDLGTLVANLKGTYSYLRKAFYSTEATKESLITAMEVAQPDFDNNDLTLDRAIALCGDYQELSSIKLLLETARTSFPQKVSDPSLEQLQTYYGNACACYENMYNALLQLNKIS